MRFLIIGGTGLIGKKVTQELHALSHEVVIGTPEKGIDAVTGKGLREAMEGTDVLIDLSNSNKFDEESAVSFFETAGTRLTSVAASSGIKHYLVLSIVGVSQLQSIGYMKAKLLQEELVRRSGIPFTIIRSTQFLQFIPFLTQNGTIDNVVHVSGAAFQPIAAQEVAEFVVDFSLGRPVNGVVEIAGPEKGTIDQFVKRFLAFSGSSAEVTVDPQSTYMGVVIPGSALVPNGDARLGTHTLEQVL